VAAAAAGSFFFGDANQIELLANNGLPKSCQR